MHLTVRSRNIEWQECRKKKPHDLLFMEEEDREVLAYRLLKDQFVSACNVSCCQCRFRMGKISLT